MENSINIAEILKKCPKGMELDCTMFEDVKFIDVEDDDKPICIRTGEIYRYLTKFGTWTFDENAKCVIFPKGKTTWEGFQRPFKDGDIVFYDNCVSIFKEWGDETLFRNYVKVDIDGRHPMLCDRTHSNGKGIKGEARFATEEEKAKLFKAIKDNGYRWNPEIKKLENLIESKEDRHDEIVMSGIYFDREHYADEVELHLGNYEIEIRDGKFYAVFKNTLERLIEPKFKVGDKIKHKNTVLTIISVRTNSYLVEDEPNNFGLLMFSQQDKWELINEPRLKVGDSNKFNINNLKPFDKVLVRDGNDEVWVNAFFGFCDPVTYKQCIFVTGNGNWCQCIPYEGNEHLLGTTNNCDEYFKIW